MNKTAGQRIKELREERGLTQAELAKLLGCAQTTVAEWERRKDREPSKKFINAITQIFDIPLEELLGIHNATSPAILCYGEVRSEQFIWPVSETSHQEHRDTRFSLKISDSFLEPIVSQGDYAIFEKRVPQDRDIVIVRFPQEQNKAVIRMWRQQNQYVMLSEVNLDSLCSAYFFEIVTSPRQDLVYTVKAFPQYEIVVEGKLLLVKRNVKTQKTYLGVKYIFS